MFFRRVLSATLCWSLCASFVVAQSPDKDNKPLLAKLDPDALPEGARLRLGKISNARYPGHVAAAAISLDGKLLAVAAPRVNSVTIVERATGKTLQHLQGPVGADLGAMTFSADNNWLATVTNGQLCVWNIATGKQLQSNEYWHINGSTQRGFSFSSNSAILGASGSYGPGTSKYGEVKAYNLTTGKVIGPFKTLANERVCGTVAPDGKTMISWGSYLTPPGEIDDRNIPQTLQVWDLDAGKELRRIKLDVWIDDAIFSPDGKTLAVRSSWSTFSLIDFPSGKQVRRFYGRPGRSQTALRFSPDGELLVAFELGGPLQAWEVKSGTRLDLAEGPQGSHLAVAFPGKGQILALGNDYRQNTRGYNTLYWWEATVGKEQSPFQGQLSPIVALAFAADGKSLITGGEGPELLWWDTATGKEQRRLYLIDSAANNSGGFYPTERLALSSDGRYATIDDSFPHRGGIRLWDLKSSRPVFSVDFRSPDILHFSPNSSTLAVLGRFGYSPVEKTSLKIWNTHTGKELPPIPLGHDPNRPISSQHCDVAFSSDGKILVIHHVRYGVYSSDLIFWDTEQGKVRHRFSLAVPKGGVWKRIVFSPDDRYLAVTESEGAVVILDATTGKRWRQLQPGPRDSSFRVAFSPDSRLLAVASTPNNNTGPQPPDEAIIEIWELASELRRDQFKGHAAGITCLAFSADGATLASGSLDMTVILWDLTSKNNPKRLNRK